MDYDTPSSPTSSRPRRPSSSSSTTCSLAAATDSPPASSSAAAAVRATAASASASSSSSSSTATATTSATLTSDRDFGPSSPPLISTPPHLAHLSGSPTTFASLSQPYPPDPRHSAAVAAAAAATTSRLGGLGSGLPLGGGRPVATAAAGGTTAAVTVGVPDAQGHHMLEVLKEAVMRSQNHVRKKSRLDQATAASNSPPPIPDDDPSSASPSSQRSITASPNAPPTSAVAAPVGWKVPFAGGSGSASSTVSSSYPFPQVRSMSASTIGALSSPGSVGPLDKPLPSGTPTPASVAFHPPGSQPAPAYENPDFPTPNMYELALLLHSEPGIEAFWSNVVKIATTCYKAERVTLAVPSDSTDLENTPWGQKATFNMAEDDRLLLMCPGNKRDGVCVPGRGDLSSGEGGDDGYQGVATPKEGEPPPNMLFEETCETAYSKSDIEVDDAEMEPVRIDNCAEGPFAPVTIGLQDTHAEANNSDWVSMTSGISPDEVSDPPSLSPHIEPQQESLDRAYRSDDGALKGRVFPTLQPLNFEADSLLDETGVSRVLQRGKTVVLSREYRDVKTHLKEREKRRKDVAGAKSSAPKSVSEERKAPPPSATLGLGKLDMPPTQFRVTPQPPTPSLFFVGKGVRGRRKAQPPKDYTHNPVLQYYSAEQHMHHIQSQVQSPSQPSAYEEYEQPVTSPWSQSPAPSPAPRPDPSENPFFTSSPKIDEETFNPASSSPVYSAQEPVNAIGCESSWTVIHIPLVHPSQSKYFSPSSTEDLSATSNSRPIFDGTALDESRREQKKAPIAILSMFSPVIPYPSNLIHSLSHFAPLVATAFSLANTHTSVLNQLNSLRKQRPRRPAMQRHMSYLPEVRRSPETMGSFTSPSESSSGFTISSVASPSWDPSTAGSSAGVKPNSGPSTTPISPLNPATENDGYFTTGRQPIFSRQNSVGAPMIPKGEDPEKYTSLEARLWMSPDPEPSARPDKDKGRFSVHVGDPPAGSPDKTPTQAAEGFKERKESKESGSATDEPKESKPRRKAKRRKAGAKYGGGHTHLHSYGADYASTFQSLSSSGRRKSKRATFELHQMPPPSNRLLRTIADSIPVHVFTAVPDTGRITWVNARMLAYRGTAPEQFLKAPWDALHIEDRDEYLRRWASAIRKGEPLSHQMRVRRFDGVFRWFIARAVPLRDQRGIIVHWLGTNMDIHDQRLAEVNAARQAEMVESESKYRSLANSSPQIVFAATANDGITFANTQWLGYSGQTLEQASKLGFMEYVHQSDRPKCCLPGTGGGFVGTSDSEPSAESQSADGAKDEKGKGIHFKEGEEKPTFSTELRLKDKHGNYRWHLVRCVSVDSNVNDGEGLWFGTCTDINDHKLLEQKLKEANEAAQKTMDSKTRFLANMSHEIRTPLIGISGMVTFLLDTPLNGEQLDYCHTISQSSDGLLSVINDILDLSKVEAGMMRLNPEWFRMPSLIEDAHELLSTMAIAKELELNFIVEQDVPNVVCGDRVRLRQVLLNIIGNAIKFTSKGEVFSRCSVKRVDGLAEDEVMLQFECHDTGPGFDEKEEEYMFKPFSQIDGSSTRAHGGSGLGLVISRQLVELHGGNLTAKGEKGKGSTFIGSAKFKIPPANTNPISNPSHSPGQFLPVKEHVLEAERFVDSPPGLTYTNSSPATTASPSSANASLRSMPSDQSATARGSLKQFPASLPQDPASMRFALPVEAEQKYHEYSPPDVHKTEEPPRTKSVGSDLGRAVAPPMFSILIVSQQPFSRFAISHHIQVTLPKNIPNQITAVAEFEECQRLIAGEDPVLFTHIVISLHDHSEIISLINDVLKSPAYSQTTVLVLTNPTQRTAIIQNATESWQKLGVRLQFIYKPIKPSRFGDVFDPAKERDASTDRYRDSAQQVIETQKKVFTRLEHEVGNKGYKVLLVEDNRVNQKVLLRFLAKVGLEVETASDGEECVEKVFSQEPGYYGLILCDLHMPRKDGFQATAEIRAWERERHASPIVPIVALSANVMSDVADKCALAGFSRYVTKPVDFKELSTTIKELLPGNRRSTERSPENGDREIEMLKERDRREKEARLMEMRRRRSGSSPESRAHHQLQSRRERVKLEVRRKSDDREMQRRETAERRESPDGTRGGMLRRKYESIRDHQAERERAEGRGERWRR